MQACRSIPKATECHSGHVCSDVATRLTPFPHPLPTSSPSLLPGSFAFLNDTKILHFVDHMQKKYITHWKHSLCNSQKLEFYNVFKDSYTPSIYLDVTRKNPNRKTLVKLRISNHKLNIETGRYNKISRCDRICPVCSLDIEDEIHFLFDCAKYSSIRDDFFNKIANRIPNYKHIPISTLIIELMNSTDYYLNKQLVQYVTSCLEMRDNLLSEA